MRQNRCGLRTPLLRDASSINRLLAVAISPLHLASFPTVILGLGGRCCGSMLPVKPPSVKVSAMALEALANAAAPKGAANRHVFLFILRLPTSLIATLIKHHI